MKWLQSWRLNAPEEWGRFTAEGQSCLNIIILLWQEMCHLDPSPPASATLRNLSPYDLKFLSLFDSIGLKSIQGGF